MDACAITTPFRYQSGEPPVTSSGVTDLYIYLIFVWGNAALFRSIFHGPSSLDG